MFRRRILWGALALLCLCGVWLVLRHSGQPSRQSASTVPGQQIPAASIIAAIGSTNSISLPAAAKVTAAKIAHEDPVAKYRLSNTAEPLKTLLRRDSALVLENARWDTTQPLSLNIPKHLRAEGDPGTYIVKSRGPITGEFRARLRGVGATMVSYMPHDAWLVRASQSQVASLEGQPGVQAVIPFEPYFKLKSSLLPLAVEQQPMSAGTRLNLLLFTDGRTEALRELGKLGVNVTSEGNSPFGPVVTVLAPADSLPAIARMKDVFMVERSAKIVAANDLSRVKLKVSTNTIETANYLGLSGANVTVAIVDSGVDMTHPDLAGRVFINSALSGVDTSGHGTHVAGIIAGSGASSASISGKAPGSVTNANFRGKAPSANLFSLRFDETFGGFGFHEYVQEQIARTNALIANMSWSESGVNEYDLTAASYDAAVRDGLPRVEGSRPMLFVWAAGNGGGGDGDGLGGFAGSVSSPGTSKNSITVGALEQLRNITNKVVIDGFTNAVWEALTDSSSEVAGFSGRGNVSPGVEGEFGRFKPDVVAPGVFTVSASSGQFDAAAYYSLTNTIGEVTPGSINGFGMGLYTVYVPFEGIRLTVAAQSGNPSITNLDLFIRTDRSPTTNDTQTGVNFVSIPPTLAPLLPGSVYFIGVRNPNSNAVNFTLTTQISVTNNLEDYYRVLKTELNDKLAPFYRYESGTSFSAPAVSGVLALMQEFYEQRMLRTNSPALMKAMLINGARSASSAYNLEVNSSVNHQGWGLANLRTSLPTSTDPAGTSGSFLFFDQSPTNALATGQTHARNVTLSANSTNSPLRITLVWTDPPGNPVAGVKLVNDLDLVVTNLDSGEVYYGNDFGQSDFTSIYDTNAAPNVDLINNVENVYISEPQGANFSVTVIGHRVNVNAVTAHPDGVVQDYAMVISSGNGGTSNALTVASVATPQAPSWNITYITNSSIPTPLFNQSVGANSPILSGVNGMTNQWHFYVATNYGTNVYFTNAAFLTFLSPTLATPRMGVHSDVPDEHSRPEADIDMYVSSNPALTNLDAAALAASFRSVGRGGTETVVRTDSAVGQVYYIGIKSEDQMAGQFGFFSVFSDVPFSSKDTNGNLYLRGIPAPLYIPDGDNANPGSALMFGIATELIKVRRVIVTNTVTHENFGDLVANLSHNDAFSVLHNHTFGNGATNQLFAYDDSGQGDILGSTVSDGPGTLRNFVGEEGVGQWMLTMLDDASGATGQVNSLTIKIEPQDLEGNGDILTIAPNSWGYDFIEVPVGATNLTVTLVNISTPTQLPVDLYIRRDNLPDFVNYDKKATINPPGGSLSIGRFDVPPLQPGTYFIGVFNPNSVAQTVRLTARVDLDLSGVTPVVWTSTNPVPLIDDAVTTDSIFVTNNQRMASVEVGLRVRHPRISDMAFQLISPENKRVLLFENRGGTNDAGLGSDLLVTNQYFAATNGVALADTNIVDTLVTQGSIRINYNFYQIADLLTVYYGANTNPIYGPVLLSGVGQVDIPYGPGASTLVTIVINEGNNTNASIRWDYSAISTPNGTRYATFTEDTNKNPVLLKFALPPYLSGTTNIVAWDGGFDDGAVSSTPAAGQFFGGGWEVVAGTIDHLANGLFGLTTDAGSFCVDMNGTNLGTIRTNVVTTPGVSYTFSYAFTRNPDGSTPQQVTILADGVPLVTLYPTTLNSWTNLVWEHGMTTFVATGTNTVMTVTADSAGSDGVLLDSLKFTESRQVSGVYYPEESLTALKGDNAYGLWKLEMWDSRVGATNPAPELVSWNLSFVFGNPIVPDTRVLEPFVTLSNTIPAGGFQYLIVDVPPWANAATNLLLFADLPIFTWFNQNILPLGAAPPDTLFFGGPVTNGVQTLTQTPPSVPPLVPGARYFIGLQNTNAVAVSYAYRVDYDITELTNTVSYTSITQSNGVSRYFTYNVSTNASAVSFDLFGMDGNLNLVARQGTPLPTQFSFDYGSFNPGLTDEQILVFTNGTPVALRPGIWYLGVLNTTINPVNYTIRATELTNPFTDIIITLTNQIPYANTNDGPPGSRQFYRYNVSATAARAQFETFGMTGDFTLVARKGLPLPDLITYDYRSARPGNNDEIIVIFTNSTPVALTSGDWFITVVKTSPGPGSYSVMASEWNSTGQPIIVIGENVGGGFFCVTWNSLAGVHYIVESTPTLFPQAWTNASPDILAVDESTTWCTAITGTMQYFRVVEGISLNGSVSGFSIASVAYTPGGIVLTWYGPPNANFVVEWKDSLVAPFWNVVPPPPVTSPTGIFIFTDNGTLTAPLGDARFYRLRLLP